MTKVNVSVIFQVILREIETFELLADIFILRFKIICDEILV